MQVNDRLDSCYIYISTKIPILLPGHSLTTSTAQLHRDFAQVRQRFMEVFIRMILGARLMCSHLSNTPCSSRYDNMSYDAPQRGCRTFHKLPKMLFHGHVGF
jgi:hypothetical protein